jgi:hypothetical protein
MVIYPVRVNDRLRVSSAVVRESTIAEGVFHLEAAPDRLPA